MVMVREVGEEIQLGGGEELEGADAVMLLEEAGVVLVQCGHVGAGLEEEAGGDTEVLDVVAEDREKEGKTLLAAELVEEAALAGEAKNVLPIIRAY